MSEKIGNIKAPIIGLEKWRKNNVPEMVWNNPYLAAYRKMRLALDAAALALSLIAAIIMGMMYEYYLIFPK